MTIRLTSAAKDDIAEAAEWYEQKREGLGAEFIERVDQAVGKIAQNPLGYAPVIGENRRCNLERFPYALWFKVRDEAIVVACLHGRRVPRLTQERMLGPEPKP